ncbi:magnesium transporter [Basilea psittacipulmonis DSM 24701]|uniref:Magnesium transporter MgtE n=1 Tax=Basilea psittacipulmonis DSM 24701 TaxID=1072685 RepID=A0A077DBZ9_9BURK|nr:magnesium transporter [Basilea psittacipulmonis DSM 24701]
MHDKKIHIDRERCLDSEDLHLLIERVEYLLNKHDDLCEETHEPQLDEPTHYLDTLKDVINDTHPADIAEILQNQSASNRETLWRLIDPEITGDVLLEVDDWLREELISNMSRTDLIETAHNLDADELADIVHDLPDDVVAEVQRGLTEKQRSQLLAAMGYAEGSVGAMMDFDMVRVREDVSLEVVLRYLRRLPELPDHTDKIFVVDRDERLQGTLSIAQLLTNMPEVIVHDVMHKDFLAFNPNDKDADAASAFERYDFISAPVVDKQNRLIGRITVAEVVDVIREDSDEESLSRAGLTNEDIYAPVIHGIKKRSPWLLFNLLTASCASIVAAQFESTVNQIVILAFLMSIVAGIGGNSGNQTMALVIRAIADDHSISKSTVFRMLAREIKVTLIVGLIGGSIATVFAWIFSGELNIGLVMAVALIGNMLLGCILGILIPLIRFHFGKDPAIGSSVLLTFGTDALGFLLFLGLATVFLL